MGVTIENFCRSEKLIPRLSADEISAAIMATKIEISDEWQGVLLESINSSLRKYIVDRLMEQGTRSASPRLRERRLNEIIRGVKILENLIISDNDPLAGSTALELRRAAHKITSSQSKTEEKSFENDSTLDGILQAIALLGRVADEAVTRERAFLVRRVQKNDGDRAMRSLFDDFFIIWIDAFQSMPGASVDPYSGAVGGPYIRFLTTIFKAFVDRIPDALEDMDPGVRKALSLKPAAMRERVRPTLQGIPKGSLSVV